MINLNFSVLGEVKEYCAQTICSLSGDSCPSVIFGNKTTKVMGVACVRRITYM